MKKFTLSKAFALFFALIFYISIGWAQLPIADFETPFVDNFENFDGTEDPVNWTISDLEGVDESVWRGENDGSSNAGGKYSYGVIDESDRALGFLASGNRAIFADIAFSNNTGGVIGSLEISYNAEHWRNVHNGKTNGWIVTWWLNGVEQGELSELTHLFEPRTEDPTGSNVTGPWEVVPKSYTLNDLTIEDGDEISIRFFGDNGTGPGARQGVAIDDFELVAFEKDEEPLPATVVDIIVGSDDHTTLAAAVAAAGLVETLQGEGPFTVFAPTDDAFDLLPEGLLDDLLDDPEGLLTDILLYHVVGALALSTDLEDGQEITTLFGEDVVVTITNGDVFINDAQVILADLLAENGVVHVIDAVLVPEVEEPEPFVTLFQGIPDYFDVAGHTERGFAVDANNVYVASRNAGLFIRVHDRLTGAVTGTLNTTGISGGTFAINDMEVSEDGVILAANVAIGEAVFKVYRVDATDDAEAIIEYPTAGGRFGDKFTLVGSFDDGSAVLYAANGSAPNIRKWTMVEDVDNGFTFGDPQTITLGVAHGGTPVVAPRPDGSFYYTASGHPVSLLNADGTLVGAISTDFVASSSTAMKYLGTDGNDDMLAIYQFGPGNENIRVVRVVNGDPSNVEVEFITPSMFENANPNGSGDVAFVPNFSKEGGNVDLYVLGTNNGVGGYTSQELNIVPPVYLPPAEPVFARAQIIHNSADPAAALVDVFVNGGLALENFAFRTATPFIDLPAEVQLTIDIAPAGAGIGSSVFTMNVTLEEDETYVIVANGLLDLDKDEISTDFTLFPYAPAREEATVATNTDVLVFHGSTDAPTVSVWAGGETPAELFVFSYGEFQPYLELPTADYILEIRTEDGETVVASYVAPLETLDLDGEALTLLASGFLTNDKSAEFGLFAALASGGALVELPLFEEEEPLIGDSCDNPIIVDVINDPLVDFEISSEPYPDLFSNTWVTPSSSYLNGNNIVFQFTLENSSFLSGSIAGSWTGILVVATCPDPDSPAEVLASGVGSTGGSFADVPLAAGDYFVVVGTWPAPQFTTMTINLSAVEVPADPTLVVVPDTLDVGFAFAGVSTVSGSVFLSNEGGADVVIEEGDITFTGAQADRFSFELADSELSFPLNIEFEEVVELIVTFDPDAAGPAEAEMVIAWNNPDETDATVALFATGYEPFTELFENFDDATPPDIPAPWTGILDVTGGSAFVDLRTIGNPYSPPHHVRLANGNNIVGDVMLVTPMVTDMESSWVRFFAKMAVSTQVENLAVGYMTDVNDAATFVPLDTFAITGTYNQYVLSLADLAAEKDIVFPENGFIAFRNNMEVTFRTFYLDDIAYEPQPTTPVFAANKDEVDFGDMVYLNETVTQTLVISNVGTGTITINETDINITGADAASFDVVYDEEMEWPIELETAETYELTLSFTPDEVRVFNADLEIEDNIGDKAVNVIALTGIGYDPTVTPPYFIDFIGDFPPLDWTRWAGELMDNTELAPVTGFWVHGRFGGQTDLPENNAARLNIFGGTRNHWLITPPIDLGDGTTEHMLNFDMALTAWNTSNPGTFGPNQYAAVVISTDNGQTWEPANILEMWGPDDEISNTGEAVTIDLSEYSGIVKLGFYGESRPGGGDVDWYVTNVHVREIQFFDVTFNVEDSEGNPITDATVTLGDQTLTATPYVFEDVLVGNYEYEVSKLGYLPVSGSVTVDDEDVVIDVVLLDAFTVDFTVTDGTELIEGALIEVFDTDEVEIASLLTNEDGQAGLIMSPGDYTYNVSAFMYLPVIGEAFSVTDQDLDITVTLSLPDPLELPFVEDFNDTIIPPLWMVIDQPEHTAIRTWEVIAALGTNTIDGTPFAIINSDAAGSGGGTLNSMLYTPAIDASTAEGAVVLSFEQYYRHLGADAFARVEVYDGAEWIQLANYTTTQGSWTAPVLAMFDITEYANDNLRVRFHYTDGGSWAWYWAIDNVSIVEMPLYTLALNVNPEGWGTVTGAGEYIEGAQVEVTATANEGYAFLNWTDEEGEVVSTEPDNIITMPDSDLTLTANFIPGVADPLVLNTLLDKIGDNLPPEIGTGGNARSAALFQERYVVVPSREDGPNVWVWDSYNPHLDPVALDMGTDIIEPLTFPINYVRTTETGIYVSNLSLNPSGDGWGQGVFQIYRWTDLEGTPEVVVSFDVLPGRLGDAFSIIGDPEGDGHIIAHINTTKEFRVWNFENGVLQNEDNPDLITLDVEFEHINNHGIINPIEGEDDIFVLTSN
ncbi:MAG: DUF4623 domain-containing protein, partial [Bacteroidetes bacterium]